MKYLPKNQATTLTPGLQDALNAYRDERNFDPQRYVEEKVALIRSYFDSYGLTRAVLGLSGGIDSAVALGLVQRAGIDVLPVLMPGGSHVSKQDGATARAKALCDKWGLDYLVTETLEQMVSVMDNSLTGLVGLDSSNWARGQLVSNLRATHLYHLATLYTDNDHKALVVGTTNLDEGGYLGYVGKVSDGLVDCQVMSDLHKSEVYAVGEVLEVTREILDVAPTGDMFDSRNDMDVFGATYDHVEILRYARNTPEKFFPHLTAEDLEIWKLASENLENLHKYNSHKYLVGSPAAHLDILPAHVQGGWNITPWKGTR